ncbi:MAG: proteasome subunit alpha, partial [Promethearchaeati archaeon]
YTTDPSGSFWGWKATAIGKESDVIRDFFNEQYEPNMDLDAVQELALEGLLRAEGEEAEIDPKEKAETIDIGRINVDDRQFTLLKEDEIEKILTKMTAN